VILSLRWSSHHLFNFFDVLLASSKTHPINAKASKYIIPLMIVQYPSIGKPPFYFISHDYSYYISIKKMPAILRWRALPN
jgi:hypothetical protein